MDHTIKKAPREKPVSIVEQSLYIQEVNGLQRKVFLKSVEKRDIMALDLFASPKEERMLTSYKPSLSMPLKRRQHSGRLYASVFYCSRALFEDGNGKDS